MDARERMRWFQTAARVWLTSALMSLALAPSMRRGLWLPLHLTLAGAASAAIGGAMPWFVAALTATRDETTPSFFARFAATNLGVAAIAIAGLGGPQWMLPAGGISFVVGQIQLGSLLFLARRRSLHRRHGVPMALYGSAVGAVVIGASLGALMASGAFPSSDPYLAARRTHLALNVIGWVSLSISGTLITFLPTVLRVRIPTWPSRATAGCLIAGVGALAIGTISGRTAIASLGAFSVVVGTAGLVSLAMRSLRTAMTQRSNPLPVSAMHLLAGLAWFSAAIVVSGIVVAGGIDGFDAARDALLGALVLGWVVQVLIGAWSYLLPTVRPGHPDTRRRWFAVMEVAARTQVLLWNVGVLVVVVAPAGGAASLLGWSAVLTAAVVGLTKAWAFVPLSRLPLPPRAFLAWSTARGLRP